MPYTLAAVTNQHVFLVSVGTNSCRDETEECFLVVIEADKPACKEARRRTTMKGFHFAPSYSAFM